LQLDASLPPDVAKTVARRLERRSPDRLDVILLGNEPIGRSALQSPALRFTRSESAPEHRDGYALSIDQSGVLIAFREISGVRAAVATLRQLLREHGRRLPCLEIRDWPDFQRRGVMLDVSRGRVPKLETLLDLVDKLADFKINELQLYTEHTFAYRDYKSVWQSWGALTAVEIRKLDKRCRELGIDLVPNQNSFGHLRYFLEDARLKKLAEVSAPYEDASGEFVRRPTTLAPNHPGTTPFLRQLYDELLPNFSSDFFNVGCDETWDLGRGQSKRLCERLGKGRVYLNFLKRIDREVSARGKRMMFWGDIILKYPKLIAELGAFGVPSSKSENGPRGADTEELIVDRAERPALNSQLSTLNSQLAPSLIALNWGYEASHPFIREAAQFAKAKIPFYVCPGTSTWMTLVGKHDNALANLRAAAKAGKKFAALGYLNTDWGDGGHPQPLAVSWLPFLAGAALSWNADAFDESKLLPVLSRDVFCDSTGSAAKAALALGHAHRKLKYSAPNSTPLGSVIAAPNPEDRELFCRDGLKCFARISPQDIRACLKEIERQRAQLRLARPETHSSKLLLRELDLAARMAAQSCKFMLWQHALASGENAMAQRMAKAGVRELTELERDFATYWPLRNKGSTAKCSPFLRWRMDDYRKGIEGHALHSPRPSSTRINTDSIRENQ